MYYLMVKKAYPSGLQYLCQTSTKDPYKYIGSGKRWLNHYRAHKPRIVTCVIGAYETMEELKEAGIYYSKLWNIVEDDNWANLREEDGMGGGRGKIGRTWKIKDTSRMRGPKDQSTPGKIAQHKRTSERMRANNPMNRESLRTQASERMKGVYVGDKNPFFGKNHSDDTRAKMSKPKTRIVSCRVCKRAFVTLFRMDQHVVKCQTD